MLDQHIFRFLLKRTKKKREKNEQKNPDNEKVQIN